MSEQIIKAASDGDLDTVKKLVEQGVDVNSRDNGQWTPLIIAAQNGHLNVVQYLIEKGADVNAENAYTETALCLAKSERHEEIVEYLIGNGADIVVENLYLESGIYSKTKKKDTVSAIEKNSINQISEQYMDRKQTINSAFSSIKIMHLTGLHNTVVGLSPDNIHNSKTKMPTFRDRYALYIKNSFRGKQLGFSHRWDNNVTVGLYECADIFPEKCCVCINTITKWQIAELAITKKGGRFNVTASQIDADKISNAIYTDRIWFPVPFCEKHFLIDEAIEIFEKTIYFSNKAFAIEVAKRINPSPILKYLNRTSMIGCFITDLLSILSGIICVILLIVFFSNYKDNYSTVLESIRSSDYFREKLILILATLLLTILLQTLKYRFLRGKKFHVNLQ